jgi:hypothetical protein
MILLFLLTMSLMKSFQKPSLQIRQFCIRLLQKDFEHNSQIEAMEAAVPGLELEQLKISLLDIVLDMLGVPEDNTCELMEKDGQAALNDPNLFCRDCFTEKWCETESEDKIRDFVHWVVNQMTHEHN